jgi:hypothetical protein
MNEETSAGDIAGVDLPLGKPEKNDKYTKVIKRIKKIKKRKIDDKQIQQIPE